MKTITEPAREIPVAAEVDVVVAGAGIAGLFAALGAARAGGRTLLVDRFGTLGGNLGPGLNEFLERPGSPRVQHGVDGLPGEFIRRIEIARGLQPGDLPVEFPFDPEHTTYVAFKMAEEAGVELMLSTYLCRAVVEAGRVKGIIVENKSGTQAILARTVIDATGETSIAATTGAPLIPLRKGSGVRGKFLEEMAAGMGLFWKPGGVDWAKYRAFRDAQRSAASDGGGSDEALVTAETSVSRYAVTEEDKRWAKEVLAEELGYDWGGYPPDMLHLIRQAWESGEFRYVQRLTDKTRVIMRPFNVHGPGLTTVEINGDLDDPTVGSNISKLEAGARVYIYEVVNKFLRKYIPGFENAYVDRISPFLGARRGRSIEAEYTATFDDLRACRRHDDVVYIYYDVKSPPANFDFPYRGMVPKKVDGLLAAGRSAYSPTGPNLRGRITCMYTGQAAGIAAAMACDADVDVRDLDVKALQRTLLEEGFYLGDSQRLKELNLA